MSRALFNNVGAPRPETPTRSLSWFRCCVLHPANFRTAACFNFQATCTFTPAINERSRRLAETLEARRMLLDFARAGAESDGEAEGDGDRSMRVTPGNSVRGGGGGGRSGDGWATGGWEAARAPSKVMAKAQQLYDEHAVNEHRKEQRRKVNLVVAAHRARGDALVISAR